MWVMDSLFAMVFLLYAQGAIGARHPVAGLVSRYVAM